MNILEATNPIQVAYMSKYLDGIFVSDPVNSELLEPSAHSKLVKTMKAQIELDTNEMRNRAYMTDAEKKATTKINFLKPTIVEPQFDSNSQG